MIFNELKFRYAWRPYQKRVLDAIDQHMDDRRLHVVAAPGAGKTTLGLEVFRRLRRSTLVLSPTRVIRDQWIDRLRDFCDVENAEHLPWVSNSMEAPGVLTSITYQALHTKFVEELNGEDGEELLLENDQAVSDDELNSFVRALQEHNIQVIILDEAHHLRTEWWRALDKVCRAFPDMVLVSLTATPPYDAQDHEWLKYEALCGPIDEEISVPELVKGGTLCPHQDFIWMTDVSDPEKIRIKEYDDRVSTLCNTLFTSEQFNAVVLAHPWLNEIPVENEVLEKPEMAIAILAFVRARKLPMAPALLKLLDYREKDIPELGRQWWQVLVESVLYSKTFRHNEDHQLFVDQLKKQLRASELLHKRELSLQRSRRLERSLSLSPSKIMACVTIHKREYKYRGEALRQVILTDYIRDEELQSNMDTGGINLGAWPVFQALAYSSPVADQIALLTGRLSIVPTGLLEALLEYVDRTRIKTEPMGNNGQYQKLVGPLNQLTVAFTALLTKGHIKTLVGTRSLLGEGWDAPVINSLLLASSVGSFMLTNQMRGRAIRIDKNNAQKISSIWHLVAMNMQSYAGWSDYSDLVRRFNTFVGLSEKENTIESGFERMNIDLLALVNSMNAEGAIKASNWKMLRRYRRLDSLSERWQAALTLDDAARVMPSVKMPGAPLIRQYYIRHTLAYLTTQIFAVLATLLSYSASFNPAHNQLALYLIMMAIIGGLLYKLPETLRVIRILFRHLPVDRALKQIGIALATALSQAGLIETPNRKLKVNVIRQGDGSSYLSVSGCTFYESSLFADCLAELLSPIDNPRYLVLRQGTFLGLTRDDYHSVPVKLAAKKELADIFYKAWCKYVGPSELVYTRSKEGRARLLKAKMKSFSSVFEKEIKRQDRWQ